MTPTLYVVAAVVGILLAIHAALLWHAGLTARELDTSTSLLWTVVSAVYLAPLRPHPPDTQTRQPPRPPTDMPGPPDANAAPGGPSISLPSPHHQHGQGPSAQETQTRHPRARAPLGL